MTETNTITKRARFYHRTIVIALIMIVIQIGVASTFISGTKATTLDCYFTGLDDQYFNNANNWDCGRVPTAEDNVFIHDGFIATLESPKTVLSLSLNQASGISGMNDFALTVINGATFSDSSYNEAKIVGDVTFNGVSHNSFDGTINGNATFNDTSYHDGFINGDATFNDTSHDNGGLITGTVTLNDQSSTNGDIIGNVIVNNEAYITICSVNGDVTFNDSSHNNGNINGNAVFTSSSFTFDPNSGGGITGTVTFTSLTPVTFTLENSDEWTSDTSAWSFNTPDPTWIFNDDSFNSGIILGDVTFNDSSFNNGGGAINGTTNFVGNDSFNSGTSIGTHTRTYIANTVTTRNFTTDGGYDDWIIIADGAVVDVSGATYGPSNDFQTLNNGSFTANGDIEGAEACDDENVTAGDGCSATMTVETGYSCTGEPSVCTVISATPTSSSSSSESTQGNGGGRGSGDRTNPSHPPSGGDTSEKAMNVSEATDSTGNQEGLQERTPNDGVRPAPVPSSHAVKQLTYAEVEKHLDTVLPPVRPAATDRQGRARRIDTTQAAPRGAVIAMILERMSIPMGDTRSPFTDVVPGSRDARAMATAWRLGLIRGDTDEQGNLKGTSRPHDQITQKEVQYIIDRIERLRRNGELEK